MESYSCESKMECYCNFPTKEYIDEWCWDCIQHRIHDISQDDLNIMLHSHDDEPIQFFSFLLENGADPNSIDDSYDRQLYVITNVCTRGAIEKLKLLLEDEGRNIKTDVNVAQRGNIYKLSDPGLMPLECCLINSYRLKYSVIKEHITILIRSGKVNSEHYSRGVKLLNQNTSFTKKQKNELGNIFDEWHDTFLMKEPDCQ